MARTRIKICGIRDADTARVAAEAGADAIGLVFADESPRRVSVDLARRIVHRLPAFIEPVGLFVNAPVRQVRETAAAVGVATVQLHGDEPPQYLAELAPLRIIKAVAFEPSLAHDALRPWDEAAALLFDAPPAENRRGGTGCTFDWSKLAAFQQAAVLPPVILAGGLTPDNVARAVETVRPYAVDVSSGVESCCGVKDPDLIRAFVRAVHRADATMPPP